MKKTGLISLALTMACSNAVAESSQETIEQWVVDTKGKPPYQRSLETVPVTDIAQLESGDDYETVTTWHVKMGGKPPYKRSYKTMRVKDIAQLEIEDNSNQIDYSGKPPYRRR